MRELKRTNPAATCHMQYDKLFVNHRCYVWSEQQGKVVEFSQADRPGSRATSPTKSAKQRSGHSNGNNNGNGALSRAGSMNSINLDTWDLVQARNYHHKLALNPSVGGCYG